jgi:hypothetical protein
MQALLMTLLILPQPGPARSVTEAGWLAGCWTLATGSRSVTEHWLGPEGGTMIGVSRTVSGGKTVEYEFLLIREGPKGLEYVAKPSRQPEAVFTSASVSPSEIVFENPAHDFPTRIAYAKQDAGLLATVSGSIDGKPRRLEFKYTAGSCDKR